MNNFDLMNKRLVYQGGDQEHRMIQDKYKSFLKALLYSYQSADIKRDNEEESYKALINPDKVKTNYDDKILSVDNKYGYKCGDVFHWLGTNTHWLVYLEQHTEDAYFRAEIRRCKYQLKWINDNKEIVSTWAYVRGPVETKVNFIQKSGISVDTPNYSLEIYIPNNEENYKKFNDRYKRFLFDHKSWEIQVVDTVSIDGVIQIIALEYYVNETLDNKEENLDNYFKVVPVIEYPETQKSIVGDGFIKPQFTYKYELSEDIESGGEWSIKDSRPVTIKSIGANSVELVWTKMISGQFTLCYTIGDKIYEKVIVVESLF